MTGTKEHIKIVGINARFSHSCLALFYVRNELENNCPEMAGELYQLTINDNYYEMVLRLSSGGPRYVFFSAAIWNSDLVARLAIDLRKCLPNCRIVIGGPQASVLGSQLGPDLCTVVIGEIEAIGPEFYQDLQQGALKPYYNGSFFQMANKGFDYPYRERDFLDHLANRHIYYESSRGCPFSCSYCLSSAEKGVYHKDLAVVEQELRTILQHRPKVVRFIDRTFNDRPDRALAIWRFLVSEGGDTLFHFEMAPDRFTEAMFDFLAKIPHGRFQFELGIQSTNPPTLAAIRRHVDPREAHGAVTRLVNFANVHLHVDLILGLPYETMASFAASFRTVFAMGAHYIQMGLLKILPDTPIRREAANYGYVHLSEPPYSVLASAWLDHAALSELYWFGECVEKFVNNRYFVSLWRYLRQKGEDIFFFFTELLAVCRERRFFSLAATQEFMCVLLFQATSGREDSALIIELLRYDWLRCGFRYLPDCLMVEGGTEQPDETRSRLYQQLPEVIPGIFTRAERNYFFRKSYFIRMKPETLVHVGIAGESVAPCLCVLAEREESLYGFNKAIVL